MRSNQEKFEFGLRGSYESSPCEPDMSRNLLISGQGPEDDGQEGAGATSGIIDSGGPAQSLAV